MCVTVGSALLKSEELQEKNKKTRERDRVKLRRFLKMTYSPPYGAALLQLRPHPVGTSVVWDGGCLE